MWIKIKRFFSINTEWQHVGLFEKDMPFAHDTWRVYIHCFESEYGERKIEIVGCKADVREAAVYEEDRFDSKVKISSLYQTELYPWLCGRSNGRIPGFEIVKSKKFDFKKKLKGEAPIILNDNEKKA